MKEEWATAGNSNGDVNVYTDIDSSWSRRGVFWKLEPFLYRQHNLQRGDIGYLQIDRNET